REAAARGSAHPAAAGARPRGDARRGPHRTRRQPRHGGGLGAARRGRCGRPARGGELRRQHAAGALRGAPLWRAAGDAARGGGRLPGRGAGGTRSDDVRRRLRPHPSPTLRGHRSMLALALAVVVLQQSPPAPPTPLPPQVGDTSPFRRLELPTPSLVREGSGRPGPRYWQQRADYAIRATLDTASHSLRGDETIRYGNNSPDTLRYVWLQLDQNLFADGSRGAALNPPGTRFAGGGFVGGYTIDYVKAVR